MSFFKKIGKAIVGAYHSEPVEQIRHQLEDQVAGAVAEAVTGTKELAYREAIEYTISQLNRIEALFAQSGGELQKAYLAGVNLQALRSHLQETLTR